MTSHDCHRHDSESEPINTLTELLKSRMVRRKRVLDDGDDSDSPGSVDGPDFDLENDPDAREERALFENPYQNKRRRTNGKVDALYGIFAESSEDEGTNGRTSRVRSKRSDWTKAPAFTTGNQPVTLDDPMAVDEDLQKGNDTSSVGDDDESEAEDQAESEAEDQAQDAAEYSQESESRVPSPQSRVEEESEQGPRMDGIGSRALHNTDIPSFSNGGIGSRSSKSHTKDPEDAFPPLSSISDDNPRPAFGRQGHSFTRDSNPSLKPAPLPASERAHFSKIQGSFGARMLAKMGWQAGTGLGVTGEGIVTPIESKLRPQKMGIAFKGFKEKTEQSKMEAKRRGEAISDEEDEKTKKFRRKAKQQAEKRSDVWKRPKKSRVKIEHKTYEQIIAEAEEVATPGIGQIIDATGAVVCISPSSYITS